MPTQAEPPQRLGAHRLLGVSENASPAAIEAAYWRLRAHIEARASGSADEAFTRERRAELDELEAALGHESPSRTPSSTAARTTPGRTPFWMYIVAIAATLVSIVLAALLYLERSGDLEPKEPAPSLVTAHARPEGSLLQILSLPEEELVMEGPANGAPIRVGPGDYRLSVAREDCPDEWTRDISLEAGDRRDFAPRICVGQGGLVVHSNVSGDRVQIDTLDVGTSGDLAHPLGVGDHQVSVEKPGYLPWSGRVRIRPEETITLLAELVLDPGAARGAQVAAPPGAQASPVPTSPPGGPTKGPEPDGRIESSGPLADSAQADGIVRSGPGGSKSWHDAMRDKLVYGYDRNGSRSLDTKEEVTSIPCEEWQSIEKSYESGGLSVNMTRLYGFDGSDAPANTLGITEGMRPYAYDRMKSCGLKAAL